MGRNAKKINMPFESLLHFGDVAVGDGAGDRAGPWTVQQLSAMYWQDKVSLKQLTQDTGAPVHSVPPTKSLWK